MAIVVMGRQKYIPDDSNEFVRIEDFQPHSLHGMNTLLDIVSCSRASVLDQSLLMS